MCYSSDDDDVYYYIRWRLKLERETENMSVCTKERKGVTAHVLMAAPCTYSNTPVRFMTVSERDRFTVSHNDGCHAKSVSRHHTNSGPDGCYARLVEAPARACFAVLPCTSGRVDGWCTGGPGHSW